MEQRSVPGKDHHLCTPRQRMISFRKGSEKGESQPPPANLTHFSASTKSWDSNLESWSHVSEGC